MTRPTERQLDLIDGVLDLSALLLVNVSYKLQRGCFYRTSRKVLAVANAIPTADALFPKEVSA